MESNILLSTVIDEMTSPVVYMRIYEMYGYALPYDFYFEKDPLFFIFAHKFDNKLSYIDYEKIYKKNDRETYIKGFSDSDNSGTPDEKPKSNITIDGKDIQNYIEVSKDELINLSELLKAIEGKRKYGYDSRKYKTIKETKNNPESSRSIIIIDFKIEVDGKFIPMVLVDMPGREDIKKSYDYAIQPRLGSKFFGEPQQLNDLKNLIFLESNFLNSNRSCKDKTI